MLYGFLIFPDGIEMGHLLKMSYYSPYLSNQSFLKHIATVDCLEYLARSTEIRKKNKSLNF